MDHAQYLPRLCDLELIEREQRMIERRIKATKGPATKSELPQISRRLKT